MKRLTISTRSSAIFSLVTLALSGAVLTARAAQPTTPPGLADCSTLSVPQDTEVNTILDKQNGLLTVSFLDPSTGEDQTSTFQYRNQSCRENASVNATINHVLETDAVGQAQICESMRQGIRDNETTVRGIQVNLAAARRYVQEWCSG